jgi:multimeric flavodoxin WrbA/nitrite reductase/ring-hydroxylating ferredoxin subunit
MTTDTWHDVGEAAVLATRPLQQVVVGRTKVALSCVGGRFGVIHGVCNHAGGPLGHGTLYGEYVTCPWHNWKFHRVTGEGEPGFEEDRVPRFESKVEGGRLLVREAPATTRHKLAHAPHPLDRDLRREPGPLRVVGISTTIMDTAHPRYSTSEALLQSALEHAGTKHALETRLVKLREHSFRACEGYYSKSAHACTWPCSISQMDPADGMNAVYENLVFWADVVLIATPIRWGAASSLYYKMVERMNCIQNQITLNNKVLIRNKVAAFIITGGQDGIQAVAGQMMGFFSEIGYLLPQFPFIAHSLGWESEEMERNMDFVRSSEGLRAGARELVARASEMSKCLLEREIAHGSIERGGRKASRN